MKNGPFIFMSKRQSKLSYFKTYVTLKYNKVTIFETSVFEMLTDEQTCVMSTLHVLIQHFEMKPVYSESSIPDRGCVSLASVK